MRYNNNISKEHEQRIETMGATNYHYGTKTTDTDLRVDDLNVGDELIEASWSWDSLLMRETIWTVVKVLKTRLVLARDVKRGDRVETVQQRFLVINDPTWAYRHGQVQARVEGQSEWSRDTHYLFTPDSAQLSLIKSQIAERITKRDAYTAVRAAIDPLTKGAGYVTVERAEEAIAALQAWIANQA